MDGKKAMKQCCKLVLAAAAGYGIYVCHGYRRIKDRQPLQIQKGAKQRLLAVETPYTAVSYNIGFGAYTPEFTFFMDGGRHAVAKSAHSVRRCDKGAGKAAAKLRPDFVMFQEVDLSATRSHHVNEYDLLNTCFLHHDHMFAVNYDSVYWLVPPWEPHGKSLSGMALFSAYPLHGAVRRKLPVASGWRKLLDLDRCYTMTSVSVENGKQCVLFHVHLSAYGHDQTVRRGQVDMLAKEMQRQRRLGNYVICGGDFNHDMCQNVEQEEQQHSWAHAFPRQWLPEGFSVAMDTIPKQKQRQMPYSTRKTDIPYDPLHSCQVTVDGFLISDNVICEEIQVVDTEYQYSDHNPVKLQFRLRSEK